MKEKVKEERGATKKIPMAIIIVQLEKTVDDKKYFLYRSLDVTV